MRVYLDHAATSPMPQQVREAYFEALQTVGNPASQHADGQAARATLESARERIARQFAVTPAEVIFTSGGTESINLALKGLYWARNSEDTPRSILLIAEGEHHATIDAAQWLAAEQGAEIVWLPLGSDGVLDPQTFAAALTQHGAHRIALASVLWANNEVGSINPIADIQSIADAHGIPLHVDGVAALGQVRLQENGVRAISPAALSLSAHKIGGPISAGALILGRRWAPQALIHGGSQQRVRSGTQDAAAATAFATALDFAYADLDSKLERISLLQQKLIAGVQQIDPRAVLRGTAPGQGRLAGNVHFTFPDCQGDSLLFLLDMAGISASTGSACTAGVVEISHVMRALGLPDDEAVGALRFTLGACNTEGDVTALLDALPAALAAARAAGISALAR